MSKFYIELAYTGIDLDDENVEEALMVTVPSVHWSTINGQVRASVIREAPTPVAAARFAVTAVREVVPQARVTAVVEDMVSVTDIADRTGFTRQHVLMLAKGERGPGDFPMPRGTVSKNQQIWDWAPVNAWFKRNYAIAMDDYVTLTRDQVTEVWHAVEKIQSGAPAEAVEVVPRTRMLRASSWQFVIAEEQIEYHLNVERPGPPAFRAPEPSAA